MIKEQEQIYEQIKQEQLLKQQKLLKIKPVSANLERDVERFLSMDPYIKIKIGSEEFKTPACKRGGKSPKWNHDMLFKIVGDFKVIHFEIWSFNQLLGHS